MNSTSPASSPCRVLLVGLGQVGLGYDQPPAPEAQVFTHSRAFSRHPSFQLAGAVDTEPARRACFESLYRVPAFSDLSTAMARLQPELVVVATPTLTHLSVVRAVLAEGSPRYLLCEKPLSWHPEEAAEIVRVCAGRGCELFVNYLRRSDPTVAELRARLADGRLPAPIKGVVWYSKGLYNSASHFVNLLEELLGGRPELVSVLRRAVRADGDPEPDFILDYPRGSVSFLSHRSEDFFHNTMEWLSPGGRLRYEGGGSRCTWEARVPVGALGGMSRLGAECEVLPGDFLREQAHVVARLAEHIEGRPAQLSRGQDALGTVQLLHQVQPFSHPKAN